MICGGIGGGALQALAQAGIQVYPGVSGDADQAVEDCSTAVCGMIPMRNARTMDKIPRLAVVTMVAVMDIAVRIESRERIYEW